MDDVGLEMVVMVVVLGYLASLDSIQGWLLMLVLQLSESLFEEYSSVTELRAVFF